MFGTIYLFFSVHISSSMRHWKYRQLPEILTWRPSRAVTYIKRLHLIRAALRFLRLVLIGLFLSKLWCLLSISSIFVTVSQAELVFSSPLPSRAAGSHQGSPGNAGQPLIPECCFTTHGTVSRRRPSSTLLPTLTSGWRAQMVARSVRLLLSAWSRSCYLTLNVATSLKW